MVDIDSAILVAPYLDRRLYHVLCAYAYWRHIDQFVRENELNEARPGIAQAIFRACMASCAT
ncbi:hypothetical protein CCGE525_30315 (plasmid) [Rhizobium jaguaris]|uniref:Uncharacterized protein n=1 Tax=Rhizobium jaguaris TaxID=1312183 RepID=A0A387G3X6_9HYPH|nr:hypothetical protein CCGE525_30315 [Rhizobium jaguaris]